MTKEELQAAFRRASLNADKDLQAAHVAEEIHKLSNKSGQISEAALAGVVLKLSCEFNQDFMFRVLSEILCKDDVR